MTPASSDPCRYLVIEGPDGSGKTTLSKLVCLALVARLNNLDVDLSRLDEVSATLGDAVNDPRVLRIAYPTVTSAVGQLIRRVFNGQETVSKRAMAFLMLADGLEAEPVVNAHYQGGGYVVTDRHPLVSGWAYQSEIYGLDYILAYQRREQFLYPERVFIMDTPPACVATRLAARWEREPRNTMYESPALEHLEDLRAKYLAYAIMNKHHARVLDGTQPLAVLVQQVLTSIMAPSIMRADGTLRTFTHIGGAP